MRYRVIEGGYWRHGTLHIESDSLIGSFSFDGVTGKTEYTHYLEIEFSSDATGLELYREMTDWLIENNELGAYRKTFYARTWWPEFFGVFPRTDGIIDFMVGEESTMWFIPETDENFDTPAPPEGEMKSWLHGNMESEDFDKMLGFDDLYPDGYLISGFLIPAKINYESAEK